MKNKDIIIIIDDKKLLGTNKDWLYKNSCGDMIISKIVKLYSAKYMRVLLKCLKKSQIYAPEELEGINLRFISSKLFVIHNCEL